MQILVAYKIYLYWIEAEQETYLNRFLSFKFEMNINKQLKSFFLRSLMRKSVILNIALEYATWIQRIQLSLYDAFRDIIDA